MEFQNILIQFIEYYPSQGWSILKWPHIPPIQLYTFYTKVRERIKDEPTLNLAHTNKTRDNTHFKGKYFIILSNRYNVQGFPTHHASSLVDPGSPGLIFPAEERSERDHDGHEPDTGDQHPDRAGAPGVNIVRIGDGPEPSIISPTLFLKVFRLQIIIKLKTPYSH